MRHFIFNSPDADPLDGYEAFRATIFGADEDKNQRLCDWCDEPADMTTPEGWPICQTCAEERAGERR